MSITAIHINGRVVIEGLQFIEAHRTEYLRTTIERHAHLLDGTAPMALDQLAQRIESGSRALRAQVTAHYLRTMEADAQRHALDAEHLKTA